MLLAERKEVVVQYLLLMYDEPGAYAGVTADERRALLDEYGRLSEALVTDGAFVGANPLEPAANAKTVRVTDGEVRVSDGQAVESQVTLGGYYLIDVASLDEAVAWGARMPAARFGPVEVRPVRAA